MDCRDFKGIDNILEDRPVNSQQYLVENLGNLAEA